MSESMKSEWEDKPFPQAYYPCGFEGCAEECTHEPDAIHWYPGNDIACDEHDNFVITGWPGWYCEHCADNKGISDRRGISLEKALGRYK